MHVQHINTNKLLIQKQNKKQDDILIILNERRLNI